MKRVLLYCIALLCAVAVACTGEKTELRDIGRTEEFDAAAIVADRKAKNEEFRTEYSPLPSEEWEHFPGLKYYEPSEKYYVQAQLEVFEQPDTIQIAASQNNDVRTMLRYGVFRFTVDGTACTLAAYKHTGPEAVRYPTLLFVPFKDKTTGGETYYAGRYIDVDIQTGTTEYYLDFNRAYNPYCAYNESYSCPLVPSENILPVAIRAGEQNYDKH